MISLDASHIFIIRIVISYCYTKGKLLIILNFNVKNVHIGISNKIIGIQFIIHS